MVVLLLVGGILTEKSVVHSSLLCMIGWMLTISWDVSVMDGVA